MKYSSWFSKEGSVYKIKIIFLGTQIKWSSNYRKVPMLVLEMEDGSHVRIGDSVLIVSALASHIADQTEGWGWGWGLDDCTKLTSLAVVKRKIFPQTCCRC